MLAAALLLAATVAFGIGIAIEKAEEGESGHAQETLLGIELESTPLVLTGRIASLVLVVAVWRFGQRRRLLGLTALFCLGFAVLDGTEASRKWGDETTIAALAILAMVLHAAAALVAGGLLRRAPADAVPGPGSARGRGRAPCHGPAPGVRHHALDRAALAGWRRSRGPLARRPCGRR